MIRLRKVLLATVIIAVTCGFLFAGGQKESKDAYPGVEGRIVVYLSGPSQMLNKLESVFEADHGDVLEFVHMGCGPLRQRVWAEMESGMIRADVFWGSDPLVFEALDKKGVLDAYVPSGIDSLKKEYRTEGNYTLVNERYGVVIYNKDAVPIKPTSYAALLEPQFSGALCHADPAQSSTALALVAGLWVCGILPELTGTFIDS